MSSNYSIIAGKKLKRRLEDLERRAGSPSSSPPEQHTDLDRSSSEHDDDAAHYFRHDTLVDDMDSSLSHAEDPKHLMSQHYYNTPMASDEDIYIPKYEREMTHTLPPLSFHVSYPAPDDTSYLPYPHLQTHRPMPMSSSDFSAAYMPHVPVTLPSMMLYSDANSRESLMGEDDSMSSFGMGYSAMDIHHANSYAGSSHHVIPPSSFRHR